MEAAVKSAKKICIVNVRKTNTNLVAEIEEILNPRSIIPLSEDPSDLEAITLGHFLTVAADRETNTKGVRN